MDDVHKEVLRKNRVFLMNELLVDELWPHLVEKEIFSDGMISKIQATGAIQSQIQRLLMDLPRRGPNAYPDFIECLIETEQQHIVDKLNEMEERLRSKEPKYIKPMPSPRQAQIRPEPICRDIKPNLLQLGHPIPPPPHSSTPVSTAPPQIYHPQPQNYMRQPNSLHLQHPLDVSIDNTANCQMPPHHQPQNTHHRYTGHIPASQASQDTVTLMDYTTTAPSSSTSHTITQTNSHTGMTYSFPAPPAYQPQNETTPDRSVPSQSHSNNIDHARKNLGSMFHSHRSPPVNQTDNPNGVSVPAVQHTQRSTTAIHTTDHPQAVEISAYDHHEVNAYPEVLGIPCTQGRMKLNIGGLNGDHMNGIRAGHLKPSWDSMYKMTSDPKGFCLIINNRFFTGHLKERLGTDVDRDNLYMLFSHLGYNICVQENLTGMEMLLLLRDFANMQEHHDTDSCVVVLLTHGLDGQVYGSDAKLINLSEVFDFFDGNNCEPLKGKPKFFLVQACRGEKYDAGFDLTDNGHADSAGASGAILDMQNQELSDIERLKKKLPSGSDFLIAYATVPGFVSWRNSEQGSWFVQALCEVFSQRCQHDDAVNMLVEVNNRVATIYESATKHKQMPSPVILLRKKLYFFPLVAL